MYFKEKILSGWGNFPQSPTKISSFQSENELRNFLQNSNIIARGMGRSYADQSTNNGNFAIDFTAFNRFISFDDDKGILECEAGTTFEKIIRYMGLRGWFPVICPATKHVTIGGAIANNIHGKSHPVHGSFVECVEEITLMLPDGRVVKTSREKHSELFWSNFGGLGLLGFILAARLRLKRIDSTYFEQISIPARNLDQVFELFETRQQDFTYAEAWMNAPTKGTKLGRGIVNFGNHAKIDELPFKKMLEPLKISHKPALNVPFYFPSFALNSLSLNILNKILHKNQVSASGIVHYDRFFFARDKINNWNRSYGRQGFVQYQLVVPVENSHSAIREILSEIAKRRLAPFLSTLKKFGDGKSGPLSFPMEGYTLSLHFPVTSGLKAFIHQLNDIVTEAGGRVYLGKDAFLEAPAFQKMYPQWGEWMKVKKKYDPDNIFSSDLSRRIGLC